MLFCNQHHIELWLNYLKIQQIFRIICTLDPVCSGTIKMTSNSFFSILCAHENFLPRLLFSHSCGHSERMGIRKLFDGSTFLLWGLNELFTRMANLLQNQTSLCIPKCPPWLQKACTSPQQPLKAKQV